MANYYPITGIPVPVGQDPPPRREISSWAVSSEPVDQIQVSLFIRAVRKLQEKNPIKDKLSFYQIAGRQWLNFSCNKRILTIPQGSMQCLYNIMKNEIIPTIPDSNSAKEAWKQAAETWRLPYWDWALPQVDYGAHEEKLGVPKLVADSQVWILKLGEKEKESVPNPLYKFTNKLNGEEVNVGDKQKMGDFAIDFTKKPIFSNWIGTSRYADPNDSMKWVNGVQNNNEVTSSFTKHAWKQGGGNQTIAHNVFRILSDNYFKSYGTFASTRYKNELPIKIATDFFSLEEIHNHIHLWTGGSSGLQGHMANVPVAAFDPVFWLHHCNVDRLFAIWQFLNADKWFDNTWGDDRDPALKNLKPFHKNTEGEIYSSDGARDFTKLGYTYPELVNTNIDKLKRVISSKYGNSVTVLKEMKTTEGRLVDGVEEHYFNDYLINIEYDRYALDGEPYIVDFYVKGKDQPGRVGQTRHLGSFFNFSAPVLPDCENCADQKQSGVKSKAQVPITLPVCNLAVDTEFPDVTSLVLGHVGVQLQDQLFWTVSTPSGQEIPLEHLKGLHVTVHVGTAQYPTDASIKVFPDKYDLLLESDENNKLQMRDALRRELR
ncbi:tyrosinase [Aspergillus novofumigatus IBT 16806]|uniref:tyrosinase n=1 Tax=Aspergillus novofumigatus (strain IBT 16806) TaxID=1392255 RepID=A0A2I1CEB6_ASPN1|nr:tyrosinase [Aspergillus novofumigatus IBT 16806]PKX95965.1 tyrosinase [Aspergillus novofumigatus IBT 16806]